MFNCIRTNAVAIICLFACTEEGDGFVLDGGTPVPCPFDYLKKDPFGVCICKDETKVLNLDTEECEEPPSSEPRGDDGNDGDDPACVPTCGSATCGPNGCGGVCGTCGDREMCDGGSCCGVGRFYRDADSDGFGNPNDYIIACAPQGVYRVVNDDDCCDLDVDAYPGATDYHFDPNGCDDYDYDCNGIEDKKHPYCYPDYPNPECFDWCAWNCDPHYNSCPAPPCGVYGEGSFCNEIGSCLVCSPAPLGATQVCR